MACVFFPFEICAQNNGLHESKLFAFGFGTSNNTSRKNKLQVLLKSQEIFEITSANGDFLSQVYCLVCK